MTIDHTKHSTAHRDRKKAIDSEQIKSMETRTLKNKDAGLGPPMIFRHREASKEQIAQRAHKIWQERGQPMGQEIDNWLLAEQELKEGNLRQA